jgi:cellulose 1,4-beta-cellobiosidase
MVLVMSLWADYAVHMLWLDAHFPVDAPAGQPGSNRGTCADSSGVPADLIANSPDATVKYGDIKFGPIGSTYPSGPSPPSPPSPSPSPPSPAPGGNVCADPGSTPACTTCSACCHSFIPAGAECDKCVQENCAAAPVCTTGPTCTTCKACCVDYLPTPAACAGCVKNSC